MSAVKIVSGHSVYGYNQSFGVGCNLPVIYSCKLLAISRYSSCAVHLHIHYLCWIDLSSFAHLRFACNIFNSRPSKAWVKLPGYGQTICTFIPSSIILYWPVSMLKKQGLQYNTLNQSSIWVHPLIRAVLQRACGVAADQCKFSDI